MLAIQVVGDEERTLAWQTVPDPICGSEEVLIDVCATALNRTRRENQIECLSTESYTKCFIPPDIVMLYPE